MGTREGRREERDEWSEVSEAAAALERELRRFEQSATAVGKMPLDSRKGLERAARATAEAAHSQEQVNAALATLVQKIQAARERHEDNARSLESTGLSIRGRAEELTPLYERFGALGEESRAINVLVQEAAEMQRDVHTPERIGVLVAFIEGIEERMGKLAEAARDLAREATAIVATDVAEQADALKQQVAAARNRIGLLRKKLQELRAAGPKPN